MSWQVSCTLVINECQVAEVSLSFSRLGNEVIYNFIFHEIRFYQADEFGLKKNWIFISGPNLMKCWADVRCLCPNYYQLGAPVKNRWKYNTNNKIFFQIHTYITYVVDRNFIQGLGCNFYLLSSSLQLFFIFFAVVTMNSERKIFKKFKDCMISPYLVIAYEFHEFNEWLSKWMQCW